MKNAPGKLKEKIVGILERHIDHNAKVTVDVHLPVIAHPEMEPRQIDVLVETGTGQRPTYTIVEVQDRKSKPSRGEFDGWLEKMKEVGAQHLICVTKAGYTKSQITKASLIGPSVRLFTLKQLENIKGNALPPSLMDNNLELVTYEKLDGIKVIPQHLFQPHPEIDSKNPPDPHYKMFIPYGREEFVSATEVTDWHLFAHPKNMRELPGNGQVFTLRYGYDCDPTKPWKFKAKNGSVPIKRFEIQIQLRIKKYPIVWEQSEYEQLGHGQVGWLIKGSADYEGKNTTVYIPLRKESDELYYAGRPYAISDSEAAFIGYGDKGYKAENFDSLKSPDTNEK